MTRTTVCHFDQAQRMEKSLSAERKRGRPARDGLESYQGKDYCFVSFRPSRVMVLLLVKENRAAFTEDQ